MCPCGGKMLSKEDKEEEPQDYKLGEEED